MNLREFKRACNLNIPCRYTATFLEQSFPDGSQFTCEVVERNTQKISLTIKYYPNRINSYVVSSSNMEEVSFRQPVGIREFLV